MDHTLMHTLSATATTMWTRAIVNPVPTPHSKAEQTVLIIPTEKDLLPVSKAAATTSRSREKKPHIHTTLTMETNSHTVVTTATNSHKALATTTSFRSNSNNPPESSTPPTPSSTE